MRKADRKQGGLYALFDEGIVAFWAIDFDVRDVRGWVGEVEVFALGRRVIFCHCRDWGGRLMGGSKVEAFLCNMGKQRVANSASAQKPW